MQDQVYPRPHFFTSVIERTTHQTTHLACQGQLLSYYWRSSCTIIMSSSQKNCTLAHFLPTSYERIKQGCVVLWHWQRKRWIFLLLTISWSPSGIKGVKLSLFPLTGHWFTSHTALTGKTRSWGSESVTEYNFNMQQVNHFDTISTTDCNRKVYGTELYTWLSSTDIPSTSMSQETKKSRMWTP